MVAGSGAAGGAWLVGAAVAEGLLADGVGVALGDVAGVVLDAVLDARGAVHPAMSRAPVPSSRVRLSHVMDPVSVMWR
jgi:hypothetical protein